MHPTHFIKTWSDSSLRERQGSQPHFLDLCELTGHKKPQELDPSGESFCFEKGVSKEGGGDGFADVWKRGFFGWEYKGKHKDLDAAYQQLLRYRDQLENPPLLIVSDMDRIIIRTNYTGTKAAVYEVNLGNLAEARSLEILRAVFFTPDKLKPGAPSRVITEEAAAKIGELAESLQKRGLPAHGVARFLDRVVFCLFAEDVGLLPAQLFTRILESTKSKPEIFAKSVAALFESMQHGGLFGADEIRYFNGNLFDNADVLALTSEEIATLLTAARLDWDAVDPSIFGTLFERGMDPDKRSQLGAHYTSRADIETLIEPVVLTPLRRDWNETRASAENLLAAGREKPEAKGKASGKKEALARAQKLVFDFQERLAAVRVLDPACGSGNFLYVALQKIKDLEKEALVYAADRLGAPLQLPRVAPKQFFGIEKNEYAFHLAQLTLWIGFLQWSRANGFGFGEDPILQTLDNFRCMDAVLDLSDPGSPKEPEWPEADFIIGNPPFLGGSKLWEELGREYQQKLWTVYKGRIPGFSDLCCYWFEKARAQIKDGKAKRVGLLATQAIRGGANREVLKRIKETGDIFFAESDRDWILDGANVHVSMVGFDGGNEKVRVLDSKEAENIHANLTSDADITQARELPDNKGICYIGTKKAGSFEVEFSTVQEWLSAPNPNKRPNSDIVFPWINGSAIVRVNPQYWIVYFGELPLTNATQYELPFDHVEKFVFSDRQKNKEERARRLWWLHRRPATDMWQAIAKHERYIATPRVSKYRIFVWSPNPVLSDDGIYVFARSDDYFFGVMHSRAHEVWSLKMGTQLEDRPRYTPTSCFETFPFPQPATGQQAAIAAAAAGLNALRENWLNPPEWTKEETLEFRGSVDGPWARYVHDPDARGIGTVRYPRLAPKDEKAAKNLAKRTLTSLYNQRPAWLANAHETLDRAVFAAYGWEWPLPDESILERLLALNLERSGK